MATPLDVLYLTDLRFPGGTSSSLVEEVRALSAAGYRVGVYSTPYLWEQIVGDLTLGVPEWRAAGETSRAEALERCGADWSIQGGEPVMGQWLQASRDHNVTCPGVSRDLGRWFAATRG